MKFFSTTDTAPSSCSKVARWSCSAVYVFVIATLLSLLSSATQSRAAEIGAREPAAIDRTGIETLIIDGKHYLIPPPWAGHRMAVPSLPAGSFRLIPREHAYNGTTVHIHVSAFAPLLALLRQARIDGIDLQVESGYRSERYQRLIFSRMLAAGRDFDDIIRFVAPPGYSQHQLGTAVDFYPSDWRFAATADYAWLQDNAARFCFEQTYSRDNKEGMPWEAWHWNHAGTGDPAKDAMTRGQPQGRCAEMTAVEETARGSDGQP
jgi:D-alanyl-D-alanine carboxypeptidase